MRAAPPRAVWRRPAWNLAAIVPIVLLLLAQAPAPPSLDPLSLGALGFRSPRLPPVESVGGLDVASSPVLLGVGPERPSLIYFFNPAFASTRPTLLALDALRRDFGGRFDIVALGRGIPSGLTATVRGLSLGFPVLASSRGMEAMAIKEEPAFALLAPDGRVLAVREGSFDWTAAEARRLLEDLLALFPPVSGPRLAPGLEGRPGSAWLYPAGGVQAAPPTGTPVPFLSAAESAVLDELNLARRSPEAYAAVLMDYRRFINGRLLQLPGKFSVELHEGTEAVDIAIAFLGVQRALPPLAPSRGLSLAARDLVLDQGRTGGTGHVASDKSTAFDRMNRYGQWSGTAGENAGYGPEEARAIVVALIVDDGFPSRGHRANIFNPDFSVVGLALGKHPIYGTVCVMDFAWAYTEK